jgi:hypothetical protein
MRAMLDSRWTRPGVTHNPKIRADPVPRAAVRREIFEAIFARRVPTFVPTTGRIGAESSDSMDGGPYASAMSGLSGRRSGTYTLFEGTSEIQRLVIARAASGMHIP